MSELVDGADEEATTQIAVGPIARPAPPGRDGAERRSGAGRSLEAPLLRLLPVAAALPAFVAPLPWLVACLLATLAIATRRRIREDDGAGVVVGLTAALLAAGRAVLRALLPPRIVATVLIGVAALALSLLAPAAIAALTWLAQHGTEGVLAAARLGAYAHALNWACALVCWQLLGGDWWRSPWTDVLRERLRGMTDHALAAVGAGAAIVALLCVVVLPAGGSWPFGSTAAVVTALPPGIEGLVLDGEAAVVEWEAEEALECLHEHGVAGPWLARVPERTDAGTFVLTVVWGGGGRPSAGQVSSVALALENQLLASVARMRVGTGGRAPMVVERGVGGRAEPATSADELVGPGGGPAGPLPTTPRITELGLVCGAAAL